jgi:hypothetical protein
MTVAIAVVSALVAQTTMAHPAQQHAEHQKQPQVNDMSTVGPEGLKVPHGREGSGTSWLPDSTPMYAHHLMTGDWMVMVHYLVKVGYDDQWSDRGSRRLLSTNWLMGMASHPLLGGEITLRSMFSAEPATAGGRLAIPMLLQSGETYGGQPLVDRQHPHDLFMEVAAMYRRAVFEGFGVELYAAPSGEPALGPTAFPHRLSAMNNPYPPIAHHWQDATHISFPVLTAGLYNRWVKLEGSIFHGREPDENRWNFDIGALDSWSGRLSANPTPETSLQVSYGFIRSPESLRPDESLHRLTASVIWNAPIMGRGNVAVAGIWGLNTAPEVSSNSLTGEAQIDLDGLNIPFVRVEWVEKLGDDLALPGDPHAKYGVVETAFGYARKLSQVGPVVPSIGAAINVAVPPGSLQPAYGTQTPVGAFVFVGLQPPGMQMQQHRMHGM